MLCSMLEQCSFLEQGLVCGFSMIVGMRGTCVLLGYIMEQYTEHYKIQSYQGFAVSYIYNVPLFLKFRDREPS